MESILPPMTGLHRYDNPGSIRKPKESHQPAGVIRSYGNSAPGLARLRAGARADGGHADLQVCPAELFLFQPGSPGRDPAATGHRAVHCPMLLSTAGCGFSANLEGDPKTRRPRNASCRHRRIVHHRMLFARVGSGRVAVPGTIRIPRRDPSPAGRIRARVGISAAPPPRASAIRRFLRLHIASGRRRRRPAAASVDGFRSIGFDWEHPFGIG